jgi:hypothetical protein
MSNPEMNDQQILELVQSKVISDDADSGWMAALLLIQMKPILKDIAINIKELQLAVAGPHDNKSEHPVKELLARSLVQLRMIRYLIEDHAGDKRPTEETLMKKRGWHR